MTEFTNRLIHEKSPYLLQHAHNPVDWYPWGEEAFQKARELDRPIFLSIGYATCHWCHVMEKESFSDPEIAKMMNEVFINVKVDREEHPEIDTLYMDFAQVLMTGGGGWPLNVILTPDQKPFLALTYIPPRPVREMMAFPVFIREIDQIWKSPERQELILQAGRLVESFAQTSNATGHDLPAESDVVHGLDKFFELTDPINGGLRGEPKFPLGIQMEFLISWSKLKSDSRALFYVKLSLEMMARGGIYDHLGGGFARYAVDEEWVIPHFEKMLYDNAILAKAYLQAWKLTKDPSYEKISRETLEYLLRDLQSNQGAFYSGEDADSGGHEGLYYTWTPEEVKEILPEDEGELLCAFYDITAQGNFEGRSVLHVDLSVQEFAEALQKPKADVEQTLEKGRKALLRRRQSRPKPIRDEKIIVSWNGLAIDVLARAGAALQEPKYTVAAVKAAAFIKTNLTENGRLLHRWCNGEARFPGLLDDYAFLIKGLLSLFEEGCGVQYFNWAVSLTKILEKDFKEMDGAFYLTDERTQLLLRQCEFYDGAEPSGNGVHCENLLRLYQITFDEAYLRQAEDILKAAKHYIVNVPPAAFCHMMSTLRYHDLTAPTVVIVLDEQKSSQEKIQKELAQHFSPHLLKLWKTGSDFPIEQDKVVIDKTTTVYICRQNRCDPPLTKLEEIVKSIEKL